MNLLALGWLELGEIVAGREELQSFWEMIFKEFNKIQPYEQARRLLGMLVRKGAPTNSDGCTP